MISTIRRGLSRLISGLCLAIGAASAAPPPAAEAAPAAAAAAWPIHRGDARLTGRTPERLDESPALLWSVVLGSAPQGAPVIADGRVVVGTGDGLVHCLDLETGRALWQASAGAAIEGPPLLDAGMAFVGTTAGALRAFRLSDGTPAWTFLSEGPILGGANRARNAAGQDCVVFGSHDMKLYCLDAREGVLRWSFETSNYVHGTPSIDGDRVVFGGCDGILHVVGLEDGKERHAVDVGTYIAAPVAVEAGVAYLGHYGGEVLGIDLATAAVRWRVSPSAPAEAFMAPPGLSEALVLASARDGVLHGLDRQTGASRWVFRSAGPALGGMVVGREAAAVASEDGRLYGVSLADGRRLWAYDVGSPLTTGVAVAGGRLVVGAQDGRLYAFRSGLK
ncbi:MAG: PQQ-binding-like beta-propeller repeat protein [Lentisphaerae bacterium]|nr:PQQ-binding-like beta-propeller repeat protein [Lentisphaerota bacterium]